MKMQYRVLIGIAGVGVTAFFWGIIRAHILATQEFYSSDWLRTFYFGMMLLGNTVTTLAIWKGKE